MLVHPETIKIVLKTTGKKPRTLGSPYKFFLDWLGDGLLLSGGARWARSRRLLTPAFHFDILKPYVQIYNEATDLLVKQVSQYADTGNSFELFEVISMCTLDIILRCAFSFESHCQNGGESHPYVKAVHYLTAAGTDRAWNPLLYSDFIYYMTPMGREFSRSCKYVHDVAEEVIDKRRKVVENKQFENRKYLDFLDVLLTAKDENGEGLSKLEIRNEVDTFLFEGHDTTASGIMWTLYALACHPEYQDKVYNEIDSIMSHKEQPVIEWDDLQHLEYLHLCIKESLRLYTAVPVIMRENTEDLTIDGKTFPAGTEFVLHLFSLHHNYEVWENPYQFIPERFTKDNVSKMDSFAFCPFSAGPRNCIGQNFATNEMKVVIANFLYRYRIEIDKKIEVKRESCCSFTK